MLKQTLMAAAAIACAGPALAEDFAPRDNLEAAHGTFRSAAPEPWYGGFGPASSSSRVASNS